MFINTPPSFSSALFLYLNIISDDSNSAVGFARPLPKHTAQQSQLFVLLPVSKSLTLNIRRGSMHRFENGGILSTTL